MGSGTSSDLLACAACGAQLPTTAKFCLECGIPVSVAPSRESRRTVTLLFTDLTGSTTLGEQLDPEAYRGLMGRYFDVARTAVPRVLGDAEHERRMLVQALEMYHRKEIRSYDSELERRLAELGA